MASRQLPNDACSSRQDRQHREAREDQQPRLRGLPLLELAEQLRVVAARELDLVEPVLDVLDDRAEVAPGDVRADVEVP